jgi:hypothetical protein
MEDLGGPLLLLIFLLGGGLFGGIWPIQDCLCTRDDVLGVHSHTLLCEECRLVLAASIPDEGANNGEQNDSANNPARNCAGIGTSVAGCTGGHTNGRCALLTGARRGKVGVSDGPERLQTTYLMRSSQL